MADAAVDSAAQAAAQAVEVTVRPEPIDAAEVLSRLPDAAHGARTLFLGVVRAENLGRKVVAVSYDAFCPLAESELRKICEEARACWGSGLRLVVRHRVGRLSVGEASVAIGVGSAHREEAYAASRYVIEEIKKRAPLWKKEHYENGESAWLRGHSLCGHGPSHGSGD